MAIDQLDLTALRDTGALTVLVGAILWFLKRSITILEGIRDALWSVRERLAPIPEILQGVNQLEERTRYMRRQHPPTPPGYIRAEESTPRARPRVQSRIEDPRGVLRSWTPVTGVPIPPDDEGER